MKQLKKFLPDAIAIVFFIVISFVYFFPAVTDGRVLTGSDHSGGGGSGRENVEYLKKTGETTRWTNTIFSGMPTYQMAPSYDSLKPLTSLTNIYHLYLPNYVWYVFIYLLGFYILMRAFDFKVWMAALGAVVWAFSSYFFIIIAAGHIWKVMALAYIPPTIAGMVLCYRQKYLLGGIVTAIFTAFQIQANHPQMSYYFLFVMFFMFIAYLVKAIKDKTLPAFGKATATLVVAGVLGVCMNLSNLYHTWEYSKETMRGKSELVKKAPAASSEASNATDGLSRDYITQWSYGVGETWSLLVPDVKGGASNIPLTHSETARKHARNEYVSLFGQLGQYWGEQPGTSGPVYVGAFVLMLFFLGCFIVKGPMKWALLAGTVFSIVLSWGRNFMGPTDFFIDYVPLYSKFRAVSSILVVAEFTIPLLAMLALKRFVEIVNSGNDDKAAKKRLLRSTYISAALTGGIALLFALMPTLFFDSFVSTNEQNMLQGAAQQGYIPADQLGSIMSNMEEMRVALFTSDCWRSFIIVAIGLVLLLLFNIRKINAKLMVGAVIVLCLADMWSVNKRYLNDRMFVRKSEVKTNIQPTATDEEIMKDKSLDYRVLNLASNTFNENETATFHNCIGGYHAAKLRRYQELIDAHIQPEMSSLMKAVQQTQGDLTAIDCDSLMPVLNMLNTKYFILPLQGGQTAPLQNPAANGNAWLVSEVKFVDNANEEIDLVGKVNTHHTAVVDKRFSADLPSAASLKTDSTSTITLTEYEPNRLKYAFSSKEAAVAVFAEIYYPGWTATIDGKEATIARANYVLRCLDVPAGNHTIELKFDPQSLHVTETIAYASSLILVIAALAALFSFYRKRKEEK